MFSSPRRDVSVWIYLALHTLPVDSSVVGRSNIREYSVVTCRLQGNGIGGLVRSRRHSEESGLGVDRVQTAVIGAEPHPGYVVANAPDL